MRFKLHATLSVVSTHTHTHTHTHKTKTKTKTKTKIKKTKHKKQNKTQQNKKNIIWAKVKHVFVHLDATLY